MQRQPLAFDHFCLPSFHAFDKKWMLLTAGRNEPGGFNCMTVSWGALGTMWGKPFAQVVVRPTRHTYAFMEQAETFTLCAFPEACRDKLILCGSESGRGTDKVAETGLTPIPSTRIEAPGFEEAELILECRKMYFSDFVPDNFLAEEIRSHYPEEDYHRSYYGEVLEIQGCESYHRA